MSIAVYKSCYKKVQMYDFSDGSVLFVAKAKHFF